MKIDWRILKYILILFVGWRIALLFTSYFTVSTLPTLLHDPPGTVELPNSAMVFWERFSTNWDAGHFRGIAENGYLLIQTVFLPLYPLLIKILMILGIPSIPASLIIVHLCTIIALYFLYKLTRLDFSDQVAKNIIFVFLIFPTAFYLGTAYSEALFLALIIPAFYFARQEKWIIAFLLAGLASVTRLVGLAVFIAIIVEYLLEDKDRLTSLDFSRLRSVNTFYIFFSLLPLAAYIYYQKLIFNSPFSFLTNEEGWGRQLSFPWKAPYEYLISLKDSGIQIGATANTLTELIFFIFLVVGLIVCFRKLRVSYSVYYLVAFIVPLLSGTLIAISRYALVIFPLFIILGSIKNELFQKVLIIFSVLLLGIFSALYINGYWIT